MELYTVEYDAYGEVRNTQYLAPSNDPKWAIEALCDNEDMTEEEWRQHSDNEDLLDIIKLTGEWTTPDGKAYLVQATCVYAPAPQEATA